MGDEAFDPTLRPLADVGEPSLTVKRKAENVDSRTGPEDERDPRDDEAERMRAAGFRLVRGAWCRR